MTKKEIVKVISDELGLTQLKTKEIVQKTFDAIVDTLVKDGRIELRNFGVFEVKRRKARKARNPRTGDRVDVPEKFVVTFKPGKEMEERVRQLEEEAAERSRAEAEAATATRTNAAPKRRSTETQARSQDETTGGPRSRSSAASDTEPDDEATHEDIIPIGRRPETAAANSSSGVGSD